MRYARITEEGGLSLAYFETPPGGSWVAVTDAPIVRPSPRHSRKLVGAELVWVDQQAETELWDEVRARRDTLLTQTDWVVVRALESGQPVPGPWLAYRQALRNITQQRDPRNINWPERPAS